MQWLIITLIGNYLMSKTTINNVFLAINNTKRETKQNKIILFKKPKKDL